MWGVVGLAVTAPFPAGNCLGHGSQLGMYLGPSRFCESLPFGEVASSLGVRILALTGNTD